jgi:trigger factor
VPTLENFEGTLDELRAKTRVDMETSAKNAAERKSLDAYIEQLVAQTTYDVPDVMIHNLAHELLHDQERQFTRYGITLEQMLQYRGQTHDEAIEALVPDAERQLKVTLALREVVNGEGLMISQEEVEQEVTRLLDSSEDGQRPSVAEVFQNEQLISSVANSVLDRKLRERMIAIANGVAPELEADEAPELEADEAPELEADEAPQAEADEAPQAEADETAPTPEAAETPATAE